MKLLKTLALSIFALFVFVPQLYAANYTISCNQNTCSTNDTLVFNQTNLSPNDSISKTIEVKNTSSKNLDITLHPISTSSAILIEKIDITLNQTGLTEYFNDTLKIFLNSAINLKNVSGKSSRKFDITAHLQKIDNTFQGKSVEFDLKFDLSQKDTSSSHSDNSSSDNNSDNQSTITLSPKTQQQPSTQPSKKILGKKNPTLSSSDSVFKKISPFLLLILLLLIIYLLFFLYKRKQKR